MLTKNGCRIMDKIQIDLSGFDALEYKMEKLTDRMTGNALRRALRQGLNVVRKQAIENAKKFDDPKTAEDVSKNVAVMSGGRKQERQQGGAMMRLGVRGGAAKGKGKTGRGGDTFYWRFLEFGTQDMAAQPFLRSAAATQGDAAFKRMTDNLSEQLDKEIAKL